MKYLWEEFRDLIVDLFIIGAYSLILVITVMLLIGNGRLVLLEGSKHILITEIIMAVIIIAIGIGRLIQDMRRIK